jgi:hypothetical protein
VNCGYVEWGNVWRIVVGFSWMNEDERFKREWKKRKSCKSCTWKYVRQFVQMYL